MVTLNTSNQILDFFAGHPDVRVIRRFGQYRVHRVENGTLAGCMATYSLAELKVWAARW
jgi:hypothetical protein